MIFALLRLNEEKVGRLPADKELARNHSGFILKGANNDLCAKQALSAGRNQKQVCHAQRSITDITQ